MLFKNARLVKYTIVFIYDIRMIHEPDSKFNFKKLILNKPTQVSGSYFIKFAVDGEPLYIQSPKASIKQMILNKSSKKSHCDLLFTQDNSDFIQWMENLESHSHTNIFENRKEWFETELEMDDIENSFTSPMKSYKSGKFYTIRTNMTPRLGKIITKIYDESETDIPAADISGNMTVLTILEIQGIKCSAKNFQIEIELKQMLVVKPVDLFDKCILKPKNRMPEQNNIMSQSLEKEIINKTIYAEPFEENNHKTQDNIISETEDINDHSKEIIDSDSDNSYLGKDSEIEQNINETINHNIIIETPIQKIGELTEINFDLDEITDLEPLKIKARDDLYYQMYREARQKAKLAKDLALSAYLEARDIKNKYMLEDVSDSDSDISDLIQNEEDEEDDEDQ
jgi:hypothetical protein